MAAPLIKATTKTVVIDRGWKRIKNNLRGKSGSFTKVGLPAGGRTTGRHSMAQLINIGHKNEFGFENIPERSFIRDTVDENASQIKALQVKAARAVTGGHSTIRAELSKIGESVTNMIKKKILSGDFIPNKPATIAKKGFNAPLIETGQMLESIQHKEVIK